MHRVDILRIVFMKIALHGRAGEERQGEAFGSPGPHKYSQMFSKFLISRPVQSCCNPCNVVSMWLAWEKGGSQISE